MISKLKGSVSATALLLTAGLALSGAAYAQDAAPEVEPAADEPTEVVVVGVRRALQNAQARKRNADTVVDSITATDIGSFPDKSVAEALQRVAGISVTRFAAKNDVMRFSAEPSGIVIRGLLQVRSEFNGRDSFSADSSYGLSWSDVSPELMGGVDAYKNVTADMIEGGIAGTVNLRTRLPFDQKGRLLSASAEANYGDLAKKTTPAVSVLWADRFDTEFGEFGFLANATHSEIETNSQGTTLPRMMPFAPGTYTTEKNYIPSGFSVNDNVYSRTRDGVSLAGQWRNNEGNLLATLQYNRSKYQNEWYEDSVSSSFYWVDPAATTHSTTYADPTLITPQDDTDEDAFGTYVPGTPFTFREDGLFERGIITTGNTWGNGALDWDSGTEASGWNPTRYTPGSTDQFGTHDIHGFDIPFVEPCIANAVSHPNNICQYGVGFTTQSRYSNSVRVTEDVALNLVWNATDKLTLNFDAQLVKATNENYDVSLGMKTFASVDLDLTGEYPKINLLEPKRYNTIGDGFADARNYSPEWIMDHVTDSEGEMTAYRADLDYDIDGTWLDSFRAGVRVADRQQQHRWSAYNWKNIAGFWSTNAADSYFTDSVTTYHPDDVYDDRGTVGDTSDDILLHSAGDVRFQGYEPGYNEIRSLGDGILGGNILNQTMFPFITHDVISNPAELAKRFSISGQTDEGGTASSSWNPICDRPEEMANSCFTGGEILDVQEKTNSIYGMLKFGGADAMIFDGITVSGNFGVRVVRTRTTSVGGFNFPQAFTAAELLCEPLDPEQIENLEPDQYAITPGCLAQNSLDDKSFSSGGFVPLAAESEYVYTLPAFNIKFGLTDEWVLRFAASRAMSKPDFGLLRNFTTLGRGNLSQTNIRVGNPNLVLDSNGDPFSYKYSYTGSTGNPYLKAITADQFDASLEYYFASVGSATVGLFYKKFNDYIENGSFVIPVTNGGVTRDVTMQGPVNGEGASISGVELAITRYFDFLPAPWDGFGVQANYTYIKNEGVSNQNFNLDTVDGTTEAGSAREGSINPGRLEGLSDHQYNLVVMYEKAKFGARLAYNWRSEYLISVNDCCIGLPVWNEAEGYLDGSLRYSLTPNLEISIQGSNLLGTETVYKQQVEGPTAANPGTEAKFMPAGWYENDRRVLLGVRIKY